MVTELILMVSVWEPVIGVDRDWLVIAPELTIFWLDRLEVLDVDGPKPPLPLPSMGAMLDEGEAAAAVAEYWLNFGPVVKLPPTAFPARVYKVPALVRLPVRLEVLNSVRSSHGSRVGDNAWRSRRMIGSCCMTA
jgi:hypothetical protein